ncbi:hypothetical protein ACRAVF_19015 [Bradyrhizobium oligotrophicum S58]
MIGPGFAANIPTRLFKYAIVGLFFATAIGALVGYEVAVWRECLVGHPWWYCLAIIQQ